MTEPPEATAANPSLRRRNLLLSSLVGTGAAVLAGPSAASTAPTGRRDFTVEQPDLGPDRDWLQLTVNRDGTGEAVPLRITALSRTESAVTVSTTTGLVGVGGSTESSGGRTADLALADRTATVWVTPQRIGSPGVPADRLVIEADGAHREIDVWLLPEGGLWGGAPNGETIQLGIYAVHAALLHKRSPGPEVGMWSFSRDRDKDKNFIRDNDPTRAPNQYHIDVYKMDDMEGRALQLADYSVVSRRMLTEPKNIFCGGLAQTPGGLLLEAGGHMTKDSTVHDADMLHLYHPEEPEATCWERLPHKLRTARWYPTVTALPDGNMLVSSGSKVLPLLTQDDSFAHLYFETINNDYLIVDPVTGEVEDPQEPLVDQAQLDAHNAQVRAADPDAPLNVVKLSYHQLATYPSVFSVPGREGEELIAMVESNRAWLYQYSGKRLHRTAEHYPMHSKGSRSYPHYGSSVLLPLRADEPPRILALGGQHEDLTRHRDIVSENRDLPATDTAEVFEVDSTAMSGEWHQVGSMTHPRILCDATLLANGDVLVSGGSTHGWGDSNEGAVVEAELYDPEYSLFEPAASAQTTRRYHSVALLLPDGSVLKAGSTGGFGTHVDGTQYRFIGNETGERYLPKYMFLPRPTITGLAPNGLDGKERLGHGDAFIVTATGGELGDRARIALIKPGSTTHGNNMDQRFVWLETTVTLEGSASTPWEFSASVPDNAAAAPPGKYMAVIVTAGKVPSEATWVHIGVPD